MLWCTSQSSSRSRGLCFRFDYCCTIDQPLPPELTATIRSSATLCVVDCLLLSASAIETRFLLWPWQHTTHVGLMHVKLLMYNNITCLCMCVCLCLRYCPLLDVVRNAENVYDCSELRARLFVVEKWASARAQLIKNCCVLA